VPQAVSIVIPTWNGRPLLEKFLPSVIDAASRYAVSSAAVEIVIVDDGGTDGSDVWTRERAASCAVPMRLVRQEVNRGFGHACNAGVRAAAHPLVFLLNNDVYVEADAIAPLAGRFDDDAARVFAVHCRVIDFATGDEVGTGKIGGFARGFLRVHRSYVTRGPLAGPLYSMFASGGSALFTRQGFLELGGFDPLFAPFYLEDVELSYRAWKRGWTVRYEPRSVVRHQFSSTIAPTAGGLVSRVSQRNRLILHWIHLHDRRWFVSHLVWIVVLLVTSPAKPAIAAGFLSALRRVPAIRKRRREEHRAATRTDREVLEIFSEFAQRRDILAYDNPLELQSVRSKSEKIR
jgi:GT2 family glycosyltransferase